MKKVINQVKFENDDTEGSDLSYESSFDEKEDNQGSNKEQKNINLFKEQMVRFLLTHPELQDEIKFSKDIINAQAEIPVAQIKNDNFQGGQGSTGGYGGMQQNQTVRPQTAMVFPSESNKNQEKKGYRNTMWESIANNIMQESKRTGTMPSIENFSQRLNLFRKKIEKPDVIEIILQNKDSLLKQIKKEEERKAKIQNRIHETIEAKLRKEQGDVKYYSKLKKNQFDSRMQKEEARVRQNKQTNNNANANSNQNNYQLSQTLGNQQYQGEKSADRKISTYAQSYAGQNSNNNNNNNNNNNTNQNQGLAQNNAINNMYSSPQQQKYNLSQSSSLQVIGGQQQQQQQQFQQSQQQQQQQQQQQLQYQQQGNEDKKLKKERSLVLNNQNYNSQTQLVQKLGGQQNNSSLNNNVSVMGLQQQGNQQYQKNQKNLRFQTPPTQQQQQGQQYTSPPPSTYQQSNLRQELENRIINSNNPIIKDNMQLNIKIQMENQKQFKTFKARPVPGVFERLSQDQVKKNQQTEVEIDIPLDIEFKTAKGEQLYREIRKKDDEEEIKRHVIRFLLEHRQKAEDEFKLKPSLLSQGQKYYSEESKEFSLLSPNFLAKKKMQEMIEKGTLTDDFFEHRANLEEGNVYLLTKVSKILKGNIMKKWKSIQDSKF